MKKYRKNTIGSLGEEFYHFVMSTIFWSKNPNEKPGEFLKKHADGKFKDLKSDDVKDIRLFK